MENKKPSLLDQFDLKTKQIGKTEAPLPAEQGAYENLSDQFGQKTQSILDTRYPEAKTLTPPPPEQQSDISWTDALTQAGKNAPKSAMEAGQAFIHPFLNPTETAHNIGALGKGLYSKAAGYLGAEQDPAKKAEDEAAANAVGEFYANRYGSMRGFKQAVAQDPFGVLLDLSAIPTAGEAALARAPGVVGGLGKAMGTVAKVTDPMRAIPAGIGAAAKLPGVKSALEAVTSAPAKFYEYRTGVVPGTLSTAYEAGRTGAPELQPFVEQMRKQAPRTELVDMINQSVNGIEQQQKQQFLSGRAGALANQAPVDMAPINQAMVDAYDSIRHGGVPNQMRGAEAALRDASGLLQAYQNQPVPLNKLEDLDALKRAVDNLLNQYGNDPQAARVLMELKSSIKNTIGAKSPDYLKIMDEAEAARADVDALRYAVGREGRVPERQLRKITTGMKDQDKLAIIDRLAENDPQIAAAIRGMSASELKMPSTLEMLLSYGLGFVASGHPAGAALAAADVASKSPRILGEIGYRTGRGVKLAHDAINSKFGRPIVEAAKVASPFEQELGKYEQRKENDRRRAELLGEKDGGRIARADGGRIDIDRGVRALMRAAENAKKSISKTTETLLEQPDEHIAQALNVAKRHI